jgi:WD40 repeat protein
MVQVSRRVTMTGHRDCVYTLSTSPQKNSFFSVAGDGMVVHWNLDDPDTGQLVARVPNSVYSVTIHGDSGLLCVGHNYEGVHFINWQEKKEVGSLKFTSGSIFALYARGEMLYAGDSEGFLHAIHVPTLQIVHSHKYAEASIRTIDVNEESGHMAVGSSDNSIRILDIGDYSLVKQINTHTNSVFSVRYSPDNSFLISAGRDAHIRRFVVNDDYLEKDYVVGHMYTINNIEFSPDGKHFVTCSMDKSIKVWDAEGLKLLKVIDKARHAGHGTSVNKLLWMEGDGTLVSASDDRTISAWDIEF